MQSVRPVGAVRERESVEVVEVAVSSAAGGSGTLFANATDSTSVTLRNIGDWSFEFRVDAGNWTRLELRNSIEFQVSLATTSIRLRKCAFCNDGLAQLQIESLTGTYEVDGRVVDLGGDASGPVAFEDLTDAASVDLPTVNAPLAAALASVSGGGLSTFIATVSTDTTLGASHYTVLVDASAGNVVITLPTAASAFSGGIGKVFNVKKIDNSVNTVTVDGNGAETIDGAAAQVVTTRYSSMTLQSNGTFWSLT